MESTSLIVGQITQNSYLLVASLANTAGTFSRNISFESSLIVAKECIRGYTAQEKTKSGNRRPLMSRSNVTIVTALNVQRPTCTVAVYLPFDGLMKERGIFLMHVFDENYGRYGKGIRVRAWEKNVSADKQYKIRDSGKRMRKEGMRHGRRRSKVM